MRAVLLLATLALLPVVPAAEDVRVPPDRAGGDVGPCHASQTFGVDDTFTTAWCAPAGVEVFHHRSGSGFAGHQCETRVLGTTVHECRDALLP